MLRTFFVAIIASGMFAGCAPISVSDVASTYYQLPADTSVVVRQAITIPPGTAHVTLQDGRVIEFVRRYEPYCQLEVDDVLEVAQEVRPGRFTAVRIVRQQILYGAERPPVLLAFNTAAGILHDGETDPWRLASVGDGPSFVLNQVRISLRSDEQPRVRELRCAGGWAFPVSVAFPTLPEIRRVLGKLISIEPE